jgi:hypothetical protein
LQPRHFWDWVFVPGTGSMTFLEASPMRIQQSIAVIARRVVFTMVREIEAVVSLAIAAGYEAFGNRPNGSLNHRDLHCWDDDLLQDLQRSSLQRRWGSDAPAGTTAALMPIQSIAARRHQLALAPASCPPVSQHQGHPSLKRLG